MAQKAAFFAQCFFSKEGTINVEDFAWYGLYGYGKEHSGMTPLLKEFYLQRNRLLGQVTPKDMEGFLLGWQQLKEKGTKKEWVAVTHELGLFYRGFQQYEKSAEMFRMVGRTIREETGKNTAEYAALLNNLAGTYRQAGKLFDAVSLFQEALTIYRRQKQVNVSFCASLYSNLAQTYQEVGEWDKAAEAQEKAVEYLRLSGRREALGPSYHNLALLYMRCGRPQESYACVDKFLAECKEQPEKKDPHFLKALNSLGGLLYQQKKYNRAAQVYDQAAQYIEKFYGKNHAYAINLQHEAWALRGAGKLREAYTVLSEAEQICAGIFGTHNEKVQAVHDELRQLRIILKNKEAVP